MRGDTLRFEMLTLEKKLWFLKMSLDGLPFRPSPAPPLRLPRPGCFLSYITRPPGDGTPGSPIPLCRLSTRSLSAAVSLSAGTFYSCVSRRLVSLTCACMNSRPCASLWTRRIFMAARRVYDTNVCLSFKGLRSHDRLHLISAAFEDNAVHMLGFFSLSPSLPIAETTADSFLFRQPWESAFTSALRLV